MFYEKCGLLSCLKVPGIFVCLFVCASYECFLLNQPLVWLSLEVTICETVAVLVHKITLKIKF